MLEQAKVKQAIERQSPDTRKTMLHVLRPYGMVGPMQLENWIKGRAELEEEALILLNDWVMGKFYETTGKDGQMVVGRRADKPATKLPMVTPPRFVRGPSKYDAFNQRGFVLKLGGPEKKSIADRLKRKPKPEPEQLMNFGRG